MIIVKHLLSRAGDEGGEAWFLGLANLHRVNIPTTADFKLPMWSHDREEVCSDTYYAAFLPYKYKAKLQNQECIFGVVRTI